MVAVGSLKKIWFESPQDVSEEEFTEAFKNYFGSGWVEVLDAVEKSFEYNAYNTAYFSVANIETLNNATLDQLLEEKGLCQPPNVVVS